MKKLLFPVLSILLLFSCTQDEVSIDETMNVEARHNTMKLPPCEQEDVINWIGDVPDATLDDPGQVCDICNLLGQGRIVRFGLTNISGNPRAIAMDFGPEVGVTFECEDDEYPLCVSVPPWTPYVEFCIPCGVVMPEINFIDASFGACETLNGFMIPCN